MPETVYKHAVCGNPKIPFSEPAWYFGAPTPYYQPKHAVWRDQVRAFVDEHITPFADEWEAKKEIPLRELQRKAYRAGVLSPWCPEELGGTPPEGGWDAFMHLIWTDELQRAPCAGAILVAFFVGYMSLPHTLVFGSEDLKRRIAPDVVRGEASMCITLTEPWVGSDLANLRTTAKLTPDGKHYVVNGMKKFITGGLGATYFSTLVRTGGPGHAGLSLLVIPANSPGITVRRLDAQGWLSGNTTLVTFEEVKVRADNLVGKEGMGFKMMAYAMNGERMIAIAGATRAARMCLTEAIKYARRRKTFGKRLMDHQVILHKIIHCARQVEAQQALVDSIAFRMQHSKSPLEVGGLIAMAKVQGGRVLEFCNREASQILGGNSYIKSGKGKLVERIAREVRVAVVGGGSEEVMVDLAGRMARL